MKRRTIKNLGLVMAVAVLGCLVWLKWEKDTSSLLYEAHEAVKKEYGDFYIPSKKIEPEVLTGVYGIPLEHVEEIIAESAIMRTNTDVFIGIKTKKGKSDHVAYALEAHRQKLCFEYRKDLSKLAKVQASKVIQFGDFVFWMVLGKNTDIIETDASNYLLAAESELKRGETVLGNIFN